MRRTLLLLLCVVAFAGCRRQGREFLGHWEGDFVVESAPPGARVDQLKMKGYVHIFLNENKYSMELANQLQVMDVEGHWRKLSPTRIELRPHQIGFTEPELDTMKAMKRPFLDPVDLKATYGKPLILDLKGDTLTGLLITVGPLTGHHVFRKGV